MTGPVRSLNNRGGHLPEETASAGARGRAIQDEAGSPLKQTGAPGKRKHWESPRLVVFAAAKARGGSTSVLESNSGALIS